ncbi:hypothetical protein D3C74_476750 [compost metagenome]
MRVAQQQQLGAPLHQRFKVGIIHLIPPVTENQRILSYLAVIHLDYIIERIVDRRL